MTNALSSSPAMSEKASGLETMTEGIENATRYYRWIFRQFRPHLRTPLLEVGSGRGGLSEILIESFPDTVLLDIDPLVADHLRARFPGFEARVICGDLSTRAIQSQLREFGFRTVLHTNTLEHLEHDVAFLAHLRQCVDEGTHLCVLVPAHPWLYGSMDRLAGHHRRYTTQGLRSAVESAGFQVQRIWHMNAVGALGWMVNKLGKPRSLSSPAIGWQLSVFDRWVVPVAARIESVLPPPFGLSLLCFATAAAPERCQG